RQARRLRRSGVVSPPPAPARHHYNTDGPLTFRDRMIPKALIFDVDGTLADTERDGHRVAFNRAFAEAGLDWVWDVPLYGELLAITGGKERIRHYVARYRPVYRPPADY